MVMFVRVFFFFFKQKTAYEMRISDWSSDVCSSDLLAALDAGCRLQFITRNDRARQGGDYLDLDTEIHELALDKPRREIQRFGRLQQIGRASCRERVCQYV